MVPPLIGDCRFQEQCLPSFRGNTPIRFQILSLIEDEDVIILRINLWTRLSGSLVGQTIDLT